MPQNMPFFKSESTGNSQYSLKNMNHWYFYTLKIILQNSSYTLCL